MKKLSFTETTQAKWNLRRLLAHHAKDVPMNLFSMSDLHYRHGDRLVMNYKGMVATKPDQTVAYVKPTYHAAQMVFSLFDDTVKRVPEFPFVSTAIRGLAVTGYRRDGLQIVAYWFNDAPPEDANGVSLADLTLPKARFTKPVLIDLRTTRVYEVPRDHWSQTEEGAVFRGLPTYDSPIVLAEWGVVTLK